MKTKLFSMLFVATLMLTGCGSTRKIAYFQDINSSAIDSITSKYELKVQRNDLLSIMINSKNPELALPFNMPMVSYQLGTAGTNVAQQRVLGYLVDVDGNIDFPILGKMKVEGKTRKQLIEMIKTKLIEEDLIKDPVVTIDLLNARISVLGEVSRPGSYNISGERMTLMEALSAAGDLSIYGRRDRVAVIREQNGQRTVLFHDLRSANVFDSPYFYLQQNDIVYVEPNKARAGQSGINQNNSVGVWISAISLLTSVAVLIINLTSN